MTPNESKHSATSFLSSMASLVLYISVLLLKNTAVSTYLNGSFLSVLLLLSITTSVVGVVLGIVGYEQSNKNIFSITGVTVGAIVFLVSIVVFLIGIASPSIQATS